MNSKYIKVLAADTGGDFQEVYLLKSNVVAVQSLAIRHTEALKKMGHEGIDKYYLIVTQHSLSDFNTHGRVMMAALDQRHRTIANVIKDLNN